MGAGLGASILVGAAASGALSAGAQYVTTGRIDPRQLATDIAIGGATGPIGGGVGSAVSSALTRTSLCQAGRNIVSGAIADITAGEKVLAHNPHTNRDEPRTVTRTHTRHNTPTWQITTTDGGTITTTPTHRFWVTGQGWTQAQHLSKGDHLQQPQHTTPTEGAPTVATSQPTGQTTTVHNLTTQGLANYYTTTTTGHHTLTHNTYS